MLGMESMQCTSTTWAAQHYTWLLIRSTPKGMVFCFMFFSVHERTCEGKDGAVRAASGQEVGHVAPPGVHKDG